MIRAAFLSAGLYVVLCGVGLLFVDHIQLSQRVTNGAPYLVRSITSEDEAGQRQFHPPEWMPFTLMGLGGVTMLYAVALPRG
ncbi:MAG TPA: hypothetical protein VNQ76_14920 [Planctomicrobium sp.]|nr:hypothetical protein [Planctomicrobium sp.]